MTGDVKDFVISSLLYRLISSGRIQCLLAVCAKHNPGFVVHLWDLMPRPLDHEVVATTTQQCLPISINCLQYIGLPTCNASLSQTQLT